jgi:hypothetical protein
VNRRNLKKIQILTLYNKLNIELVVKFALKITSTTESNNPTVSGLFKSKVKGKLSFRKVRCPKIKLSSQYILGVHSNRNIAT